MNADMEKELEERDAWLAKGIEKQWVTPPFCNTHDGDPYMTEEEEAEWDKGGDPCMVVLKVQ